MSTGNGAIARMAVITSEEHSAVLEEWLEGAARACEWTVGERNPDIEAILRSYDMQKTDVAVLDDDAMVHKEVSEEDVVRFSEFHNRRGMRIVFLAGPERDCDDPYLVRLIEAGVSSILPTRAYADDPDGCRCALLALVAGPAPTQEEALEAVAAIPAERKSIIPGKRRESPDVLSPATPDGGEPDGEPKLDEFAFFSAMRAHPSDDAQETGQEKPAPQAQAKKQRRKTKKKASRTGAAPEQAETPVTQAGEAPGQKEAPEAGAKPPEAEEELGPQRSAPRKRRALKVAVCGLKHGAGATHLAISTAFYFTQANRKRDFKVCCLLSDKREFDLMTRGSNFKPTETRGMFEYKGVTFAFMGTDDLPDGFDILILDCDVLKVRGSVRTRALFNTSELKLVVCGGSPWHITDVSDALSGLHRDEFRDWTWCLFGASTLYRSQLEKILISQGVEPRLFNVPYDVEFLDPASKAPQSLAGLFTKRRRGRPKADDKGEREDDVKEGGSHDDRTE